MKLSNSQCVSAIFHWLTAWLHVTHPVVCGFIIGHFLYMHQWLFAGILFVSIMGVITDCALEYKMYDHS